MRFSKQESKCAIDLKGSSNLNKAQVILFVVAITAVIALAVVTYVLLAPPSGKSYQFVWQTAYFHAHASSEYQSDTFTVTGERWYIRRAEYAIGISAPVLIIEVHDAQTSQVVGTCSLTSSNAIGYFTPKGTFFLTVRVDQEPSASEGQYTDSLQVWEYK